MAKNIFAVVVLNQAGNVVKRKLVKRDQMPAFISNYQGVVALEAYTSAHYWARKISQFGRDVQLLPPQHVKAYLRSQKNDYNDAQAIAEVCQHGTIRSVPMKSVSQQDRQAFHRVREQLQKERRGLYCHIRGLLGEYGIVIPRGTAAVRRQVPWLLEEATKGLSDQIRLLLN